MSFCIGFISGTLFCVVISAAALAIALRRFQ